MRSTNTESASSKLRAASTRVVVCPLSPRFRLSLHLLDNALVVRVYRSIAVAVTRRAARLRDSAVMQALRTVALLAAFMPASGLLAHTSSERRFLAVSAKKKPAAAGGFGAAPPSTPKTKKKARRPRPAPSTRPRHSPVAGHAGQEEEGRRARPRSTVGHGRLRRERDPSTEARRQDRQTRRRRRARSAAIRWNECRCEA